MHQRRRPQLTLHGRCPRLRLVSYNVGEMSADLYDVFVTWLHQQYIADVVGLQETHWGLGRADGQWTTGSWHFACSADPTARYSGVCVCISNRFADSWAISIHLI